MSFTFSDFAFSEDQDDATNRSGHPHTDKVKRNTRSKSGELNRSLIERERKKSEKEHKSLPTKLYSSSKARQESLLSLQTQRKTVEPILVVDTCSPTEIRQAADSLFRSIVSALEKSDSNTRINKKLKENIKAVLQKTKDVALERELKALEEEHQLSALHVLVSIYCEITNDYTNHQIMQIRENPLNTPEHEKIRCEAALAILVSRDAEPILKGADPFLKGLVALSFDSFHLGRINSRNERVLRKYLDSIDNEKLIDQAIEFLKMELEFLNSEVAEKSKSELSKQAKEKKEVTVIDKETAHAAVEKSFHEFESFCAEQNPILIRGSELLVTKSPSMMNIHALFATPDVMKRTEELVNKFSNSLEELQKSSKKV